MPDYRPQPFLALLVMLFLVPAHTGWAQTAPDLIVNPAPLPMRNLQIEVRQVRSSSASRSTLGASGTVRLQPGHSGAQVNLEAQSDQRAGSGDVAQRLLVLNGRSANIMAGNSVPLRLLHSFVQNGIVRYGSGTVLVNAGSGFSATPLWRGGDSAELELAAVQSTRLTASPATPPTDSRVVTTLVAPLNEWVTVAQSDEDSSGSSSGLFNNTQSASRTALTVQLRISLR
ncbi:hypothetical protein [Polaromonas sp. A23]|uniref:hypothetical protein n=1 Tax=Polaromonas sp. A23 TaxID=1944133 RepID=UPI00098525F4|nr:hypothetical protein [Polaromonas sp. A23]OOG48420.1 hypothetical protein B0B52_00300 [Polaromonas sp. A23]